MAGMDIGQPPKYVSIEEALTRLNQDIDIMGVVIDFLPIGPTRGSGECRCARPFEGLEQMLIPLKISSARSPLPTEATTTA